MDIKIPLAQIRAGLGSFVEGVIRRECMEFLQSEAAASRLRKLMLDAVPRNPKILECAPESVALCLMTCAELGLQPSAALGHIYLIPRWSKRAGGQELGFIVGYKGYLELIRRNCDVANIFASVAYRGEEFTITVDSNGPAIHHVPSLEDIDRSPEAVLASYVVVRMNSGAVYSEWCSRSEIMERKAASGSRGFSPWQTHFDRMARKCAIRKLVDGGTLPLVDDSALRANQLEVEAELEATVERQAATAPRFEALPESDAPPLEGLFDSEPQPERGEE